MIQGFHSVSDFDNFISTFFVPCLICVHVLLMFMYAFSFFTRYSKDSDSLELPEWCVFVT